MVVSPCRVMEHAMDSIKTHHHLLKLLADQRRNYGLWITSEVKRIECLCLVVAINQLRLTYRIQLKASTNEHV